MYQDLYLKFTSEKEAKAVLYRIEGAVEANEELGIEAQPGHEVPNYQNIDVLGVIYERPPEPLPEDYVPVALEGWHVNVRVVGDEDATPLVPFSIDPKPYPMRVWA